MNVIQGKYKGKKLKGYDLEKTRPTMNRVKESLFNMIQMNIKDKKCLDLFAGTGALGIEALSMGAKSCDFVDNNDKAIGIINENLKNITEKHNIYHMDYKKYLKTTNEKYDIIFLDPPYHLKQLNKTIKYIEENNLLNKDGILVCEYEEEEPISSFEIYKFRKYGKKMIKILKNL